MSGVIPPLVPLLRSTDPVVQESGVTALLNLSAITAAIAIKPLAYALRTGTHGTGQLEGRVHAAQPLGHRGVYSIYFGYTIPLASFPTIGRDIVSIHQTRGNRERPHGPGQKSSL